MDNQGYREIFKFDAANLKALNDTLRALWKKVMGRVELKDLSGAARTVIDSKAESKIVDALSGRVSTNSTKIQQNESEIRSKAERSTVNAIGQTVDRHSTQIIQNADGIRLEAERATAAEAALQASVDVQADRIELAVGRKVGGTNLISCAQGRVTVTAGEVSSGWAKSAYCMSGHGVTMTGWSGTHNEVRFWTDVDMTPGEYMLSFWCWQYGTGDAKITIRPNLYYADPYADIYFDEYAFEPVYGTPTRYELKLTVNHTGKVNVRFLSMTPWSAGEVYITDVKLERGNVATAWSPSPEDPAGSVVSGSSVVINEDEIRAVTKRFEIAAVGDDGVTEQMRITKDGAVFRHLEASNVARQYDGAAVITVNPQASADEISAGGVYRSLKEACSALTGRHVPHDVTIEVMGDSYGLAEVFGVCGSPHGLTIRGNGHAIIGSFRAANCTSRIYVENLTFAWSDVGGRTYAADFDNCAQVELNGCTVNGNGAQTGLYLEWGTRATVKGCGFFNVSDSLVIAGNNVDLAVRDAKGNGPYFIWTDGANVKWQGSRPGGVWWKETYNSLPSLTNCDLAELPVDDGTGVKPDPLPVITTAGWDMLHADSYAGGFENSWNYQGHDDIMQGYTEHAGRIFGCMWFDNAAIRSAIGGKTVKQAMLRLTAQKFVGRGVEVSVHLWGTATGYAGRNGAPELTKDYGIIGRAVPGETADIVIPPEAAADLAAGTIQGLMLYSDDTELHKDRNYSTNYMRFDGGTKGSAETRPRLTVTYEN